MNILTQKISEKQPMTNELIQRAKLIEQKGIKPLDSFNIASAELMHCNYLITTDKEIIEKYQKYKDFFEKIKICNPILFITEVL